MQHAGWLTVRTLRCFLFRDCPLHQVVRLGWASEAGQSCCNASTLLDLAASSCMLFMLIVEVNFNSIIDESSSIPSLHLHRFSANRFGIPNLRYLKALHLAYIAVHPSSFCLWLRCCSEVIPSARMRQ
eukprot:4842341-Amphidinium_carterae.2